MHPTKLMQTKCGSEAAAVLVGGRSVAWLVICRLSYCKIMSCTQLYNVSTQLNFKRMHVEAMHVEAMHVSVLGPW